MTHAQLLPVVPSVVLQDKMCKPRYQDYQADDIPAAESDGASGARPPPPPPPAAHAPVCLVFDCPCPPVWRALHTWQGCTRTSCPPDPECASACTVGIDLCEHHMPRLPLQCA